MGRKRKQPDDQPREPPRRGRPPGPKWPKQITRLVRLCRLGERLFKLKPYDEARQYMQKALDLLDEPIPGVSNQIVYVAQVHSNFVDVDFAERKWPDAVNHLRRAIAIYDYLKLPDHQPLARLLPLLIVHGMQQQLDDAERVALRAVAYIEQHFGRDDLRFIDALGKLATVYYQKGKGKLSERLLLEQLQLLERKHGPDHPAVAKNLPNLAHMYRWMRRPEQAEPYERRAKEIEAKQPKPEPQPPA